MTEYVVSSDNIDGREQSRIDALCDALEKKGHTTVRNGVGPNTVQSYGMSSAASGKVGVFICGGVDIQVFWDFVQGISSGYYHYKRFIYVYASDTATSDKWLTCNGAKNTPTVQAHDDNYSGGAGDAIGKTVHQYCSEHKDIIWYACGKLGCSFDEVIENFLAGEGAGSDDDKEGSSGSTIKDALKQLLAAWDGEVECKCINEYVYVNKIQDPQKRHRYYLAEGLNIHDDSVTINDYNPDTINFLTVHWQGGEDIVYRDEKLIARFGEKPLELDAVKKITVTSEKEKTTPTDTTTTTTTTGADTDIDSDIETIEDTTTPTDTTTTSTESETTTEEVPVETLEEAETFARTEWAKIKRDDGHSLECKVTGSEKWHPGEWAKVYLPSFDLDDYMYLTKVSQSEDNTGDWTANLNLVDYPPSFGEETETEEDSEEDTEEEIDDTTDVADETAMETE